LENQERNCGIWSFGDGFYMFLLVLFEFLWRVIGSREGERPCFNGGGILLSADSFVCARFGPGSLWKLARGEIFQT